jgi:hypothetical protein
MLARSLVSTARRTLQHNKYSDSSNSIRRSMSNKSKSEGEWRAQLSLEQFRILREKVSQPQVRFEATLYMCCIIREQSGLVRASTISFMLMVCMPVRDVGLRCIRVPQSSNLGAGGPLSMMVSELYLSRLRS